jgi:phosphonopyruvate decarboxylase
LSYVSSANEGDAVATCAGATLGGQRAVAMMQNSGLGNAVSPLTSLAYVFRTPLLLIVTLRGDPDLNDEPQHQLMGRITGALLETMAIPWEYFPADSVRIGPTLERAQTHMARELRPYALIMRKDAVASFELPPVETRLAPVVQSSAAAERERRPAQLSRGEVLRRIIELTPERDTIIIATTGYTGRELFALSDRPNHLYMVGSMGCASSLGLGLAMTCPRLRVVVIDGDGAALMRMGNFATLGAYGGANLVHILLDNGVHDSTGAQATVSPGLSFAGIATACGYAMAVEGDSIDVVDDLLDTVERPGPRFGCIRIQPGVMPNLPRPSLSPVEARARFMEHIGTAFSFARKAS